jgi:hypothetical protein
MAVSPFLTGRLPGGFGHPRGYTAFPLVPHFLVIPHGIEWKGIVQFTASVMREFAHGKMFSQFMSTHKPDVWGEWKELGIMAAHAVPIEKKNGRITADQRGPFERASIDCAAIPQ